MADAEKISKLWALCGTAVTLAQKGEYTEERLEELLVALETFNNSVTKENPETQPNQASGIGNARCKCGRPIPEGDTSCGSCNRNE